ncbi:MAG TPA: hypothetical protein VK590_10645 [Saprospiraceae bacterium]|nr:hypothetical protein [Saprospiraceae bacterium]
MSLRFILTIFSFLSIQTFSSLLAQNNTDRKNEPYIYCEIYSISFLSSTILVRVDSGEEKDKIIQDKETGKDKRFNSMVDTLNYMSNEGWEFVQAFPTKSDNEYIHYLLRKLEGIK